MFSVVRRTRRQKNIQQKANADHVRRLRNGSERTKASAPAFTTHARIARRAEIGGKLAKHERKVLGKLESDIPLDPTFRFLDFRDGTLEGIPVRLARVSYTGELSFEVNVARRSALKLWTMLMNAGKEFGITPVGSETSGVLRIEKGFISPGHEGDNITNPFDAGMGWIVDMTKPDFIGKRSLLRDIRLGGERQHVVGLLPDDESASVADGSALLPAQGSSSRSGFQGHVTAACFSPTLERAIALGLLKDGQNRHGEKVVISGLENSCAATVTAPVFYDPKGERMRG